MSYILALPISNVAVGVGIVINMDVSILYVLYENTELQDKVNYAVSEREDRVTDVTTITG